MRRTFRRRPNQVKKDRVFEEAQPYVQSQPTYHDHLPKPTKVRLYGVVVKVFKDKGFGFIKDQDNKELYFRCNGVVPEIGQKTSYVEGSTQRGPIALELKF